MDSPIASRVVDVDDISLVVKQFHLEEDEGNGEYTAFYSQSLQWSLSEVGVSIKISLWKYL